MAVLTIQRGHSNQEPEYVNYSNDDKDEGGGGSEYLGK